MHIATYIGLLEEGSKTLAASYRQVAQGHAEEADVVQACGLFAGQCHEHEQALSTLRARYGRVPDNEPERLHAEGLSETRSGGLGLLRDLHDLHMLADYLDIAWRLVGQAGPGSPRRRGHRRGGQVRGRHATAAAVAGDPAQGRRAPGAARRGVGRGVVSGCAAP